MRPSWSESFEPERASSASGAKQRPAPSVVVAKVVARDVPVEVQAPVDLRPLEQVDVGSKVLGYVDAVLVERGDRVKKGQVIALVRPSDLPDQLSAARSSIGQIKAQAALARTNYERASKLAPSGVVSQQELQSATAALASAEAAEAAMHAQISGLAIRLGETRITSPIAGYVSARRLDPGALVSPTGGAIVTVVRMDRLRVFLSLTETDAVGISVGVPVGPMTTTSSPTLSAASRRVETPISSAMSDRSPCSLSTHAPVSAMPSIASRVPSTTGERAS